MSLLPDWHLPPTDTARILDLCRQFRNQWQPSSLDFARVSITPYLPAPADPLYRWSLFGLVLEDFRCRWEHGERLRLEDYLELFPELGSPKTLPVELIVGEWKIREALDSSVNPTEYRRRFPAQFDALQRSLQQSTNTIASQTLEVPTGKRLVDSGAPTEVRPIEESLQRVVQVGGGYRLLERLGKGSYGEVWRAEAPGGVQVAIKIVSWPVGHELTQMELRALELTKQLRHPFLIQLQAYWQVNDQVLMAMELADFSLEDLDKKLRRLGKEGIALPDLIGYFRESAEALDYLHRENVVHRDVKPANILIVRGHAKIGDLGTARLRPTAQQNLRATTLGTPYYMAPETWQQQITPQSDQYSLASAYVELRLHRTLFNPSNQLEAAQMHLTHKPDLSELPRAERRVLLKALSKRHEDRYPTCVEFIKALEAAVFPPPTPKFWRRLALALLLIMISVGVLGALSWPFVPESVRAWMGLSSGSPIVDGGDDIVTVAPTVPNGFEPTPDSVDEIVEVGTQRYYARIQPIGKPIVFVLVPETQTSALRTFYIMQHKVSNAQFAAFVAEHPEKVGTSKWEQGTLADGTLLPAREHPDLPVFNVTVNEAIAFAQWLGGRLPSAAQWDKAAGRFDHETSQLGPFSEEAIGPDDPLSIGRDKLGPLPVTRTTKHVSYYNCRDMEGNGLEWTRNLTGGLEAPQAESDGLLVILRGQSFEAAEPLTYQDLQSSPEGMVQPYNESNYDISFRVVAD